MDEHRTIISNSFLSKSFNDNQSVLNPSTHPPTCDRVHVCVCPSLPPTHPPSIQPPHLSGQPHNIIAKKELTLFGFTISKQIVKRNPHRMAFKPTSTKGRPNHEITVSTSSSLSTKIALPRASLRTHSIVIIFPRHTCVRRTHHDLGHLRQTEEARAVLIERVSVQQHVIMWVEQDV